MATQVVQAVVITAIISLILAAILFYFVYRFIIARRLKKRELGSSFRREAITVPRIELRQHGRALKGFIVDEEGLDVLYLRKLEDGHFSGCFSKVWYNPMGEEVKRMNSRGEKPSVSEPIQEIPLLREPIRAYQDDQPIKPLPEIPNPLPTKFEFVAPKMVSEYAHKLAPPPLPGISRIPPSPPPTPLLHPPPPQPPPPPPPPPPPSPPPPPPPLPKKGNTKPAAPTGPLKSKPNKGLISSHKPPIPPRSIVNGHSNKVETTSGVELKLKPLHWDKVSANVDHSMVWNEINDGSFRFDDELIESLFGYTTTTQKTTEKNNKQSTQGGSIAVQSSQVFLLDPRKSQNTAIVLKSLAISRKEILDSLLEGKGLNTDTLEKLTKICPTQDEITKILQYNDNPTKLAYAESFLYHILKSVPSAFFRFNTMLFKTTYDSDILHLKESLQTLELGCKELRSGGVFYKLLEAILKAGNRMNAGTSRGNAQGFNLSALRRLSDVKSTDGKTTLLYFVVEQVIRSEGKRRSTNQETDREYLRQGLPIIVSLSSEFANVKKAAAIDYDNFINMSSVLTTKVEEIKKLLTKCRDEAGGFVKEMKGFLEDCEEELRVVREEEIRVMEHVRRTTVYYQAGVNQIQLFIVVKDFLNMVDQVCVEIGKKYLEKRKVVSESCSSPPLSPTPPRSPLRFHNLQSYFKAQNPGTSSSDSEDDFL